MNSVKRFKATWKPLGTEMRTNKALYKLPYIIMIIKWSWLGLLSKFKLIAGHYIYCVWKRPKHITNRTKCLVTFARTIYLVASFVFLSFWKQKIINAVGKQQICTVLLHTRGNSTNCKKPTFFLDATLLWNRIPG